MLRVETQEADGALICRLEGRFTGDGAEDVRLLVIRCDSDLELVVDLTEVMFIDAVGEEVLLFLKKLGGHFVAETAYSHHICERLQLPLISNMSTTHKLRSNKNGKNNRTAPGRLQ